MLKTLLEAVKEMREQDAKRSTRRDHELRRKYLCSARASMRRHPRRGSSHGSL